MTPKTLSRLWLTLALCTLFASILAAQIRGHRRVDGDGDGPHRSHSAWRNGGFG